MKDCPNCGINESETVCTFCNYPIDADQTEITRFLARQSMTKVSITESKRISKISGQVMSVLSGLQILILLFFTNGLPISFIAIIIAFPVAYLMLGIASIFYPIPGVSIAIVLYIVEKYFLYSTNYEPGFLGILFSLAFLAVLIIGLVNGIKYINLRKKNPFLYAQITGSQFAVSKDLID